MTLTSLASIASVAESLKADCSWLNILPHNAYVMMLPEGLPKNSYEVSFSTNCIGYTYLTHLLLLTLKETTRTNPEVGIIFVSLAAKMMGLRDPYKAERLKNTRPHLSTTARFIVIGPLIAET
ncbi:hypothetical protein CC79DRAFT_1151751 [Sarocladium strictum]